MPFNAKRHKPLERKPFKRADKRKVRCQTCEREFEVYPNQLSAKYCSPACAGTGQKRTKARPIVERGKGKADREWQRAVREKDDYRCQRCRRYDPYIHTHHVATRAQRPDLKHEVSNGMCLCGPCHQWVHGHPIEAEKAGFLSTVRYELERSKQQKGRTPEPPP